MDRKMVPPRKSKASKLVKSTKAPKGTRASKMSNGSEIQSKWPVWYFPDSPLGSAVKYVASLSSNFNWVGIYILKNQVLELGPFIGEPSEHLRIPIGKGICGLAVTENKDQNIPNVSDHDQYLACSLETKSELVVLIRDPDGEILGQIDIDSHTLNAFGPEEEKLVKQVAKELGELWPEQ